MNLIDANLFPQAAEMIHNKKLSDKRKLEIKAMYIEALINFMDIFAQTEIGEGIEIDLQKVALFVNSNVFENRDCFYIKTIDDIYTVLEFEVLNGLPLWRFLKLTEYQNKLFEDMYGKTLIEIKTEKEKCSKCYTCIWYEKIDTMFGILERCKKPSEFENPFRRRQSSIKPIQIKSCKYYTSLSEMPELILNKLNDFYRNRIIKNIEERRIEYVKENSNIEDIYGVPAMLNQEVVIDFDKQYDPLSDLAFAFNNKRTISERKKELRYAIYFEGMIRFIKTYIDIEIGNDFIPDIKNIILYLNELFDDNNFDNIKNINDVYLQMEDLVMSGFDIKGFLKRK